MFHHLFFVMSLSGSVVVILYGLTYPITRRFFPHAWRKRILYLSLFFYLFPVPEFKYRVSHPLSNVFPALFTDPTGDTIRRLDTSYMINPLADEFFIGSKVIAAYLLLFCLAVIAFVVIVKQVWQYRLLCRRYLSGVFQQEVPPGLEQELRRIKDELNIHKNVKLIFSELCDAPMTIGLFSPTIIFPAFDKLDFEPEDDSDILKHELLHIKHRDLPTKFLALLVLALHWYNPLCYLLYHELCTVSELDCDYEIVKETDDLGRKRYGSLILDVAAAAGDGKEKLAVGLIQNSAATFKRRILEIKNPRENSRPVMICLIMAAIFLAGTATTFVYQPPKIFELNNFHPDGEYFYQSNDVVVGFEPLPFDCFFTDENGQAFPFEEPSSHTSCPHDYADGTITEHTKNTDEECIVVKRKARRCRFCGDIEPGNVVYNSTFYSCPH